MAVKVGDSWVSQEAYNYAKSRVENSGTGEGGSSVLSDLSHRHPDINFSSNTAPFSAEGTNNIAVSPKILKEMENDADARMEYEALIYDCAKMLKETPTQRGDSRVVARGVIINDDGSCGMWSISQSGNGKKEKYQTTFDFKKIEEKLGEVRKKRKEQQEDSGAVYVKSGEEKEKPTYEINRMSAQDRASLVEKLKADQEARERSLLDIVQKTLYGQGKAFGIATGDSMWRTLAGGNFTVDAATRAQAQKDISEDGYWGVKQTSQRLFDFASALAGDDVEQMKKMQAAMEKGFKLAGKSWGGNLPGICQQTLGAANQLFADYYREKGADGEEQ